jgi:hypothetical protein
VFDDEHLVSCAGLVPVMTLATQTGLPELLADKICIPAPKIKSGSANPSPKLATLIAGMCAGADSIDDLDVVDRFTARLVVRRVKDARFRDALFPVWRYHPFFTNTDLPTAEADITHRQHAIIETVFSDLIDGPLAHIPSGQFGANSAWVLCAAIAHNLLRAAGVLAGGAYAVARGATLRRKIVTIPARLARPQRRPILHLPSHWPWIDHWLTLWRNTIGYSPPTTPTL